jgi:RND family efflux transporter MFP subunit
VQVTPGDGAGAGHAKTTTTVQRTIPTRALAGIALTVLAVLAILFWMADGGGREAAGRVMRTGNGIGALAPKVITETVKLTGNDRVFEAIGTGRARLSVQVFPASAGEVTAVHFRAGQRVQKGDVLVQLDDREQKLAVRLAEVRLAQARNLLSRYEQAVKDGAVPQSEVESARSDVQAAEVALDQAKLDLEHRKVLAPFSGVVGIPLVDPGDRVTTSTLITGLDDRDILQVDFEIPEALAGVLGSPDESLRAVTATTPAWPGRVFQGTIHAQESRVNPERRTLLVRASIVNEEDLLRPGMSFTTRWAIPGGLYPTVPEIALQWGRDGSFVWVVREGAAERVPARVVARSAGSVLVDGEVRAGEQVVVEGLQRLTPGARVEVVDEEA